MTILEGIRVLDFGTGLAAPYAAMMLADLGADVTKVEKPRRGDLIRFTDSYIEGKSGYFLGINRGKRSVTLDLREPRGQEVALALCEETDVLFHNFRPGLMERWGLSYDDVASRRPDIVYCSVSAFGSIEGLENRPGNDIIAQAYSGLMALTGPQEGAPAKAGAPVTDVSAACMASIAVLAALHQRERTGKGAHVETSLIEAAYGLMPNYSPSVLNAEPRFRRMGSGHPQLAPYQAYGTRDAKHVVIGVFHRESWVRLCNAIGRPDLAQDERFSENSDRVENRRELNSVLNKEFQERDLDSWVRILEDYEVPFAPVLEVEESVDFFVERDPDLLSANVPSNAGTIRMMAAPFKVNGGRPAHPIGAPELGEHTDTVLSGLGLSNDEIEDLRRDSVI